MSTAGRINKSSTKFAPKRRAKPSTAPAPTGASSTGTSVAGTPRVAAAEGAGLAPVEELDIGGETFRAPLPPAARAAASGRGDDGGAGGETQGASGSIWSGASSGFALSDPSLRSTPATSQASTAGTSFGPSDPSLRHASNSQSHSQFTTPSSSFAAPLRSPSKSAGTSFTFSQNGPSQAPPAGSSQQVEEEAIPAPKKKQLSGRTMKEVEASRSANGAAPVVANAITANANAMDLDPISAPPPPPDGDAPAPAAAPKKLTAAEKGKGKAIVKTVPKATPKVAPVQVGEAAAAPVKKKYVRKSRARVRTPPPPVYDADGVLIPPVPVAPKRMRGPNKPKIPVVKQKVMKMVDGVEVEVDVSDEEPAPKKRKSKGPGRAKATKLDREIFDNPNLDGEGGEGDEAEGEPELDENGVAIPKKGKGKRKLEDEELPTVDSGTWTMSSISTPRDVIGGRISGRFLDCQKKDIATKQARNLRRKKMRDRATRRAKGEPSASEAEEEPVLDAEGIKKNESRANSEKAAAPAKTAEQEDAEELISMNGLYPDDTEENARNIAENRKNKIAAAKRLPDLAPLEDLDDEDDPMVDRPREEAVRAAEGGGDEYDSDGDLVESQYAPQMRIVDGEMVIDDASLEVDRSKDARIGHVGDREVIEESARDRYVNSGSWGKQKKTEKWTNTETTYFYNLLGQFGTDFEMIARLFPTRTRAQIKAKWMKEEKINSAGVTVALMNKQPIDMVEYARVTGMNLGGPVPVDPNEAVQKRRAEAEKQEREAPTKFGANGREEEEEEVVAPVGRSKKAKKAAAAALAAKQVFTMEVDDDYREPVAPVAEVEEDAAEALRAAEVEAEIEQAEEAERMAGKKKKKRVA